MFGPKKECAWTGCGRRIDYYGGRYCRRHENEHLNEILTREMNRAAYQAAWGESGASKVWLQASVWLSYRDGWEKKLAAPDTDAAGRQALVEALARFAPVFAIAEEIKSADDSIEMTLLLGQTLQGLLDGLAAGQNHRSDGDHGMLPAAEDRSPAEEPSWTKLPRSEASRKAAQLCIEYFEACRRGDIRGMVAMSGAHDGALMAVLLQCATAVVPVYRESVGDDVYLEAMDGFATPDNQRPGDLSAAMAVQMLNAQGGIPADNRWTGSAQPTVLTAEMVARINFFMAIILVELINLTAEESGRDEDEAFRHFISLLKAQAA